MGKMSRALEFSYFPKKRFEGVHIENFLYRRKKRTSKMKAIAVAAILFTLGLAAEAACPTIDGAVPEVFSIDGCNTCTCQNGGPACTRMMCDPARCEVDYWVDPCNHCVCNNGQAACTMMFCFQGWYD